jgi:hypothetical protein
MAHYLKGLEDSPGRETGLSGRVRILKRFCFVGFMRRTAVCRTKPTSCRERAGASSSSLLCVTTSAHGTNTQCGVGLKRRKWSAANLCSQICNDVLGGKTPGSHGVRMRRNILKVPLNSSKVDTEGQLNFLDFPEEIDAMGAKFLFTDLGNKTSFCDTMSTLAVIFSLARVLHVCSTTNDVIEKRSIADYSRVWRLGE